MTREDILKSPEYWVTKIQVEIFRCADTFMKSHNMNRTQFAEYLGVSKGYVTQILAGDYNYSIMKLVDMALKIGYVPSIDFAPVPETIQEDLVCAETVTHSILSTYSDSIEECINAA